MPTDRRAFLGQIAASATVIGGLPMALGAATPVASGAGAAAWDLSWTRKLRGRHKAVFDVPEIESGYGVWRATIWGRQYEDVLGVKPSDMTAVLVLRHNAIHLAMQQAYWDRYGIGKTMGVKHPVTGADTHLNPALLASARNEVPAGMDAMALDQFLSRGGIALACDLAFRDVVDTIAKGDGVGAEEAQKRGMALMVPGVVMQPSGVFASIRAQELGCTYLRAS